MRNCISFRRSAFTLVELLVSMAISLIMVYAMVQFMVYVGDSVGDGRAMIELSGQLRGIRQRLHEDLSSLTVSVRPWPDEGGGLGYFEIYEGPKSDTDRDGDGTRDPATNTSLFGDFDDWLGMTIQAKGEPFVGRYPADPSGVASSRVAEVVWFTGWNDKDADGVPDLDETRYLYRRQMLIWPEMPAVTVSSVNDALQWMRANDISVRVTASGGNYTISGNSLSDLTQRQFRFAHLMSGTFPHALDNRFPVRLVDGVPSNPDPPMNMQAANPYVLLNESGSYANNRLGEDIQLSRCIGFDVRVFDPTAPLFGTGTAAGPSDIVVNPGTARVGQGAYVDLFYSRYFSGSTSVFSAGPDAKARLNNAAVYDTWSSLYERDGVDQDGDSLFDEGTDGLDNDGNNGVDDVAERETSPPYPVPLRGVQVMIRAYDADTRQMRQATVVADFVPE